MEQDNNNNVYIDNQKFENSGNIFENEKRELAV